MSNVCVSEDMARAEAADFMVAPGREIARRSILELAEDSIR